MKKLIPILSLIILAASCKKDKDNDDNPDSAIYINSVSGSLWSYHEINNSGGTPQESDYTVTSTSRDTAIEGKTFHIYAYSYGGFQYLNNTNSDYYQYDSIPGLSNAIVRLYLRSNAKVGDTWNQSISVPVPNFPANVTIKISNKVLDIGSRTVNGTTYNNVIQVQTTLSSALIPADNLKSEINTYYAENYGLVESSIAIDLDYQGITEKIDVNVKLTSATLK